MLRPLVSALALVLAATGAPAMAAGVPHAATTTADARDIPLIDQTGAPFTLRQIGRPTAVIFVAARCGDACPIAEALFAKLSAELRRGRVDARLLTVTLDPDTDSAFTMANLARAFRADPARWRWASGKPDDVRRLLDAFNVPRLDGKFHGTFAYVLDAQGIPTRLVLLSTSADAELLGYLRAGGRG
ncbi:MAG: SCO family protein [Candidatus Eremiobacteraeota bacterium]|nr:SCO family protein [Candidatus Eremiobacteraeota bacterium]